jgi:hypothetical protein
MNLTFEYLLLKSILTEEMRLDKKSTVEIKIENNTPYLVWKDNSGVKRIIDISNHLWETTENMFYILMYGEMITLGYFIAPIPNGFLCISPKGNEYQISTEPYQCSCGNYQWKSRNKGGPCKHILMLKGTLLNKKRAASYLSNRFKD